MTAANQNRASDPVQPSANTLIGQTPSAASASPMSVSAQGPLSGKPQTTTPVFYSFAHPELPPLPFNPFPDLAVYLLGDGLFIYDDRSVDYVRLQAEAQEASSIGLEKDAATSTREAGFVLSGGQTEGEGTLTIARTADGVVLSASGLQGNTQYALLSKKDLWQQHWEAECVFTSSANGQWSKGPFQPNLAQKFYQVSCPPLPIVSVECYCDTIRDNAIGSAHNGRFLVRRRNCDVQSNLVVLWTVSGTASPETDYVPLEGQVTISSNKEIAEVEVEPCTFPEIDGDYETVVVTLKPDSNYWIDARYSAATNKICRSLFTLVVQRDRGPIGIDYYPIESARYGPWAGKIVTGDESHKNSSDNYEPVIYTIDQQANVEEFRLRVAPEDFDIIQGNQCLYCNDANWNVIWKVPSWYFAEHVGDILVTQAGEVSGGGVLEGGYALLLIILHWDPEQNRFVQKVIFHPWGSMFEHVTFAPIDL